jgi:glycosyltransferase involved in cell wall biosynthesis
MYETGVRGAQRIPKTSDRSRRISEHGRPLSRIRRALRQRGSSEPTGVLGPRLRLVWATNLPAPYRLAAWDELNKLTDELTVWVLATNEQNRAWDREDSARPYLRRLATLQVAIGGVDRFLVRMPLWALARRLRRADAVVIGGWDQPFYWRLSLTAKALNVPRVLFYESTTASHQYAFGLIASLRRIFIRHGSDVVLVPGEAARRTVIANGMPSSRVVTTFNSIDQDAVLKQVSAVEREVDSGPFRYCFVGQLVDRKNVASLLRAFLVSPGLDGELHVVGEGPLLAELQQLAVDLEGAVSESRVVWHGGVSASDAISQIVNSQVLVLPSKNEVWGLVVNEALTAGLSVVVSATCGVASSVAGMRGVYLCDTSVDSIRRSMEQAQREWSGRITAPEIIRVGSPKRFATDTVSAVNVVRSGSRADLTG